MEESVKNLWLDKIKSGKVAVIESHYAPKNNTNCIWLKDGVMYVYGNSGWESLGSGSGGGGGVIKLPVQFDTIEVTGDSSDSGGGERGNTKGPSSTTYYCKQKVSGDLFGPTENAIVVDLAYYYGGGNPKGGDLKATKSDLDDVSHSYFFLSTGELFNTPFKTLMFLQTLGLDDDPSAKVLVSWSTEDENEQRGPMIISLIYKGSNYLYIVDMTASVLAQYYNNPDFRDITIMESENGGDDDVPPEETA